MGVLTRSVCMTSIFDRGQFFSSIGPNVCALIDALFDLFAKSNTVQLIA